MRCKVSIKLREAYPYGWDKGKFIRFFGYLVGEKKYQNAPLPLLLPLRWENSCCEVQLKPGMSYTKQMSDVSKGGEENTDCLGPWDCWNDKVVILLAFLSHYHRLAAGEAGNPKMPTGTYQKSPNKSLLSLATGPRKGQPPKSENVNTVSALLQPTATEKPTTPLPTRAKVK